MPSQYVSVRSILILPLHLPVVIQVVSAYVSPSQSSVHFSSPLYMPCALPISSSLICHPIYIWCGKSGSTLLCSFLNPPVTSSLIGPYIFLSTLFSDLQVYLPAYFAFGTRCKFHSYALPMRKGSS